MPSIHPSSNQLLQALPAAELEALRPRLETVELVRETVLVCCRVSICRTAALFQ